MGAGGRAQEGQWEGSLLLGGTHQENAGWWVGQGGSWEEGWKFGGGAHTCLHNTQAQAGIKATVVWVVGRKKAKWYKRVKQLQAWWGKTSPSCPPGTAHVHHVPLSPLFVQPTIIQQGQEKRERDIRD